MELEWFTQSNAICFLQTENEQSLASLVEEANRREIKVALFHEEDLERELTAVAFEPTLKSRQLLSQLPLAFR